MHTLDRVRTNSNSIQLWLLFVSTLLIAFNWHFIEYSTTYLLFWCAALAIAWRRRNELDLESNILATSIGLILIVWLLFRGVAIDAKADVIARTYPSIAIVSLCLLASKPSKIFQYWRELIIVMTTGIPWEHLFNFISATDNISLIDARIARLMLWYVGFDVHQTSNLVILPEGSIQIAGPCSSFALLGLMWQFSLIICFYFSLTKNQKILLWLGSTVIAFGVNGVRLCLMALLVANKQEEAFHYWHGHAGAEIFTTIAILLLSVFYWFFHKRKANMFDSNLTSG
ncbi:MAG: cyanoexosortase A [Cyanobacteria bacterium P01_G01_bin.19]